MFESPRVAGTTKSDEEIHLDIPKSDDLPIIVEYLNDPQVMIELDPQWKETTMEQEQVRLQEAENDPSSIMWYIRVTGKCIGAAWINDINLQEKSGAFGIMIGDKEMWGQGIASKVADAISEYAFTHGELESLHVALTEANTGSYKVAIRAGYTLHKGEARFIDGKTYEGYEGTLTKEDWLGTKSKAHE
jgi:ribosomal-protein-alanine N-acetyltransferase